MAYSVALGIASALDTGKKALVSTGVALFHGGKRMLDVGAATVVAGFVALWNISCAFGRALMVAGQRVWAGLVWTIVDGIPAFAREGKAAAEAAARATGAALQTARVAACQAVRTAGELGCRAVVAGSQTVVAGIFHTGDMLVWVTKEFFAFLQNVGEGLANLIIITLQQLWRSLVECKNALVRTAKWAAAAVAAFFVELVQAGINLCQFLKTSFVSLVVFIREGIANAVRALYDGVVNGALDLAQWIATTAQWFVTSIPEWSNAARAAVRQAFHIFIQGIRNAMSAVKENTQQAAAAGVQMGSDAVVVSAQAIENGAKSFGHRCIQFLSLMKTGFVGGIGWMASAAVGVAQWMGRTAVQISDAVRGAYRWTLKAPGQFVGWAGSLLHKFGTAVFEVQQFLLENRAPVWGSVLDHLRVKCVREHDR